MTATEVAALGGAFASFLRSFSCCFSNRRTLENFVTYCRGLLGKIRRKSVEPIALASGSGVRALQWFLSNGKWDHDRLRDMIQQRVATHHCPAPGSRGPSRPNKCKTSADTVLAFVTRVGMR